MICRSGDGEVFLAYASKKLQQVCTSEALGLSGRRSKGVILSCPLFTVAEVLDVHFRLGAAKIGSVDHRRGDSRGQ